MIIAGSSREVTQWRCASGRQQAPEWPATVCAKVWVWHVTRDTWHVTCHVWCAGNAVDYEWRSTGVCTNVLLSSATDTLSLYLESGGGSDCVQVKEKSCQVSLLTAVLNSSVFHYGIIISRIPLIILWWQTVQFVTEVPKTVKILRTTIPIAFEEAVFNCL